MKRILRTFFWIGMCLCLVVRAHAEEPHHSQTVIRAFNEGVKHFNAGEFNDAIPSFDIVIENDPHFPQAYYARGACHHSLQHPEQAISDLNAAIRLDPALIDAYALRGAISYETRDMDSALADFNFVLKRRSSDAQSLLGRGVIYLQKQSLAAAEHDFRKFLKLRPDDPLAPRLRKLLASISRDTQGAEEESSTVSEEPESATSGHGKPAHRTRVGHGRVSEDTQRLSEGLLLGSHEVTNSFTQKVMRGERAEAVGHLDAPGGSPHSKESGIPIVTPQ